MTDSLGILYVVLLIICDNTYRCQFLLAGLSHIIIHELRSHKAIVPCNQHMKTFVVQEISELSNLCTLKVGCQLNVLVDIVYACLYEL